MELNSQTQGKFESLKNTSKYPYVTCLPYTQPSPKYIKFKKNIKTLQSNWNQNKNIHDVRKYFASLKLEESGNIKDANNCKISHFKINYNNKNTLINVHKIEYHGSNINNGVIIEVHGGGYCVLSSRKNFGFAETLSKLTGCIIFLLDYKLAPEYPIPFCVNELIILYEYLLNNLNISSTNIAMTGDSAGGGMILLALQSIKYGNNKYKKLPQPSCVWLNSPWCNLANDNESNIKNKQNETMMGYPLLHNMADWSVGNKDKYLNLIANNNKKNEIYSPMYGKFNGLCCMYFMVGMEEILLDDSLICAKKAFDAGVDVRCDVSPIMMHVWPSIVNIFPESLVACSKACDWIMQQFRKNHKQITSKL
eukprot:73901_1